MPRIRGIDRSAYEVGTIVALSHNTIPFGCLICDGSLLSVASYPKLFAKLHTTYGGDGVTTFGLPDHRGRFPISTGFGSSLTSRSLGTAVGSEQAGIDQTHLPGHTHAGSTSTSANGAHSHTYTTDTAYTGGSSFNGPQSLQTGSTTGGVGDHTHPDQNSDNAGTDATVYHDNVHPAIIATVVIAYA